jgi:hypothetical protein
MRAMSGLQKFPLGFTLAVVGFLLTCSNCAKASDEVNSAAGLAVYSDINFIELEGEFVGLQVVLVPYNGGAKSRLKMLWRSAGPFLNPPLLLDVDQNGKTFKIVVPAGQEDAGAWTLSLKGNVLYAAGPGSSKYTLKKVSPK